MAVGTIFPRRDLVHAKKWQLSCRASSSTWIQIQLDLHFDIYVNHLLGRPETSSTPSDRFVCRNDTYLAYYPATMYLSMYEQPKAVTLLLRKYYVSLQ